MYAVRETSKLKGERCREGERRMRQRKQINRDGRVGEREGIKEERERERREREREREREKVISRISKVNREMIE